MGLAKYILFIIYFWDLLEPCKSMPYRDHGSYNRLKTKIRYLYTEVIKHSVKRVQNIKHFKDLVHSHAIYQAGELQYYIRKKFLRMMLIYYKSNLNASRIDKHKQLTFLNEMHKLSFEIDNLVQMLEDNHGKDTNEDLMPEGFDKHNKHYGPNITDAQYANHSGSGNGHSHPGFQQPGRFLRKGHVGKGILQMGPPHIVNSQAQSVQRLRGGYNHPLGASQSNYDSLIRQREIKKHNWLLRNKKLRIENQENKNIAAIRLESGFDSDVH